MISFKKCDKFINDRFFLRTMKFNNFGVFKIKLQNICFLDSVKTISNKKYHHQQQEQPAVENIMEFIANVSR